MATELSGLPQISQDGKYVWFTDKTGEYDIDSNPTGWGSPNFELDQSALLVFWYLMQNPKVLLEPVNGSVKHSAAVDNDFEFVFQAEYLQDGYHQIHSVRLMVSTDDLQSIDTVPIVFTEGNYWYNSGDNQVKQLVSGVPVIQDLTDNDILDAIEADSSTINLLCEKNYYKNLAVEKNNKYTLGREARRNNNEEQENRMRVDGMDILLGVATADYQFRYGFKTQAHDTIESLLDDFKIS